MKPRPTQFGTRENTASSRQHASRLAGDASANAPRVADKTALSQEASLVNDRSAKVSENFPDAAEQHAATGGEESPDDALLTVGEVAATLKVPRSWVYERTRRRGRQCLPHIRLGKYLRFEIATLRHWLAQQRSDDGILSNRNGHER